MAEIRICRICLSTGVKMYRLDRFQLKAYYEEVMALKVNDNDNLPQYVCYECSMMLHKFHKFKEKCYCGQKSLKELLWKGPITYENVNKIDRAKNKISPILQVITASNRIKFYNCRGDDPPDYGKASNYIKAEGHVGEKVDMKYIGDNSFCVQSNHDRTEKVEESIVDDDSFRNKGNFDGTEKDETVGLSDGCDAENTHQTLYDVKPESLVCEIKLRRKGFESWTQSSVGKRYNVKTKRRTRFLNAKNWKKYTLSAEEAVKEFRARCESTKYLRAAYKCTDCYKGFSKEDMLNRHVQLRHSELLGVYECRFCKMRFKWDSHLRIHMRQHFTKYQCLLCHFVCPLENSAILHEEYHSGVKRKCIHCDEEFRHASTYYTHLRTSHRSEYVCTTCGLSFVSETGLHQHKRVKHLTIEIESPDDDDEVNTFCDRCDINFDTRKAYDEHLFHSVLHAEGVEHEIQDEVTIPRKVLGKRLRAKITKELRKRKQQEEQFDVSEKKRRKKPKRKRRKPTTCHQCGQHFDTQAACMRHHLSQHPRTSFYPPAARHICELCGASLAPGSVAVHQNMHTKEKMFSCDTCGKQFHSTVGLRRHLVTHTGEKRFACSLCDKRFTQSNSMKLHYRTFHLKQPYPKRDRRKRREAAAEEGETEGEEEEEEELRSELDSPPDPNVLEPVHQDTMLEPQNDDTVHYLMLN